VTPQSTEELARYLSSIEAADASDDHATLDALIDRALESEHVTPGQRSTLCETRARSLLDRGFPDQAEAWAQEALAHSGGQNADAIRKLIERANSDQGHATDPRFETHGDLMAFAMLAFEQRSGDHGQADFEYLVNDSNSNDETRGRARYYLGVIAYQARDFDVARAHFEFASDNAPSPEIGYAAEALEWRYQEEG
jgi:tetratricopeptide (TPR) repeat protein